MDSIPVIAVLPGATYRLLDGRSPGVRVRSQTGVGNRIRLVLDLPFPLARSVRLTSSLLSARVGRPPLKLPVRHLVRVSLVGEIVRHRRPAVYFGGELSPGDVGFDLLVEMFTERIVILLS